MHLERGGQRAAFLLQELGRVRAQRVRGAFEPRACSARRFTERVSGDVAEPPRRVLLEIRARELQELREALRDFRRTVDLGERAAQRRQSAERARRRRSIGVALSVADAAAGATDSVAGGRAESSPDLVSTWMCEQSPRDGLPACLGRTLRGRLPPRLDDHATVRRAQYAAHAEAANVDREAFAVEVRDEILRGRRLGDLAVQRTLQQAASSRASGS